MLPLAKYSGASMGNLPIGQGLAVTPMQMAVAYSAIANGGMLRPAHIVERVNGRALPAAQGPPDHLRGERRVRAPDARGRARPRRHRLRRGDQGLRAGRQDRHGPEARPGHRRLLARQVRRLVRRLRARAPPEAARHRDGRRAEGRDLRRPRRRPGVQADHLLRAELPAHPARSRVQARGHAPPDRDARGRQPGHPARGDELLRRRPRAAGGARARGRRLGRRPRARHRRRRGLGRGAGARPPRRAQRRRGC